MQKKILFGILLLLTLSITTMIKPSSAVDTLVPADFQLQSFSKTLDFFDFARAYAAASGKPVPPADWHAYLYQNYVNVSGFQLYYSGLINITTEAGKALTIPVQNFIEHYKTPGGKDVLTSSSFIMLLAFNDTATSLYPNSPDVNDNLYASFSLGFDITNMTGSSQKPALSSKAEIIPLVKSADNTTWTWGMRYTNLTAIWWRLFIDPLNPHYEAIPIAITTYEELTFKYTLTVDAANHTAKVTASYVIGRMTNLWLVIGWFFFIPIIVHLNSTGTYRLNGTKISNQTIYQFLEKQRIKMSIVLFQNSLVLGERTASTFNSKNVTDANEDVSNGAIQTDAGNEKIFESDFGTKATYSLYNYTSGQTTTYNAVTRTAPRPGFAKNPLFAIHVALLRYVPLIIKNIDPALYESAKDHMLNMTYADYFYLISYPTYSGYKLTHDPTYTAYIATPAGTTGPGNPGGIIGLIVIIGIIAIVAIVAAYMLRKRGTKTTGHTGEPPAPPSNP